MSQPDLSRRLNLIINNCRGLDPEPAKLLLEMAIQQIEISPGCLAAPEPKPKKPTAAERTLEMFPNRDTQTDVPSA